jgi:hypothetical protein
MATLSTRAATMLALASVCDEIADNIEDHLTGGEDHAPRGPFSKLS